MDKKYLLGIFLLASLFLITLVSAQPQTTIYAFPEGYTIVPIQFQTLKLNEDVTFNFYVKNSSTGVKLDNTTIECNFNLADSQGNVLFDGQEIYQPNGFWTTTIDGSYFNETGYYYYGVDCEDGLGGSFTEVLEVTPTGENIETQDSIILAIAIFVMFSLAALFIILSYKVRNGTIILISFFSAVILTFVATLFTMTLIENLLARFSFVVDGFSTYLMVFKIIMSSSVLGLVLYSGWSALQLWKFKTGRMDR